MDILSIVTLIALAVALGMVVITARLLRDERRRSEARIAALSAAAADVPLQRTPAPAARRWPDPIMPATHVPAPAVAADDLDLRPSTATTHAHEIDTHDDLPGPALLDAPMFGTSVTPARRSGGVVALIALVVLVAGITIALMVVWPGSADRVLSSVDPRSAVSQTASTPPLELVALRHRRDGDRLSVSGIVKNPSGARVIKNVTAVVFLFDRSGSFLSSGRAPVDFTTLTPGDESPFVVVVTEPGSVARYRVSFRSDDHVVPHVDRREPSSVPSSGPAVSRTSGSGDDSPRFPE